MTKAIVYTAPKCPHSLKLKEFLKELDITFEEKGVFTDPGYFDEIFQATEQRGLPVVLIDGDTFVGFDKRTQRKIKRKVGA
ncbi:MAG: glutaredoxin family protein [Candidatus Thorarchaeota archaeon]